MSLKVKSFDGINTSSELVSTKRITIPNLTGAVPVAVAGSLYYDPSTDELFRSDGTQWILIQDGVNSLGSNYERNITVAQSGADHTTIEAAILEAILTSPPPSASNFIRITIYPGTYDLASNQTVPQYTSLFGIGDVFVDKSIGGGASDHYFSMIGNSQINGIQFIQSGATNSVCIRYSNSNNLIRNCTFRGPEVFIRTNLSFSQMFLNDVKFNMLPPTITGFESTQNNCLARISGLRTELPSASATIFLMNGSSQTLLINDIYCDSGVDKIFDLTNTTGTIIGGRIDNALTTAVVANTSDILMVGITFNNNNNDLDLQTNGNITLSGCEVDFSKIIFGGGSLRGLFQNMLIDDYTVKTVSPFSSGDVLTPTIASFGGGNANVNGMRVFHCQAASAVDTGSGFVEITDDVKFDDGFGDSIFASPNPNECLLIGNTRGPFAGIYIDNNFSALPQGLVDETVVEYFGGVQFNETTIMATQAEPSFTSTANQRFIGGKYNYRFGYLTSSQTQTTINGILAYWMRFRVVSLISNVNNFTQVKVNPPARMEINTDGFTEVYNDTSIKVERLKINFLEDEFATPSNVNQELFVAQNFRISLIRNRFRVSVDSINDFIMPCPDNINTAKQLTITAKFMGTDSNSGDVLFNFKAAYITNFNSNLANSAIFTTSGAAPVNAPGELFSNNITYSFGSGEDNQITAQEFSFNIEPVICRDPLVPSPIFVFNLSRLGTDVADTYAGDINILNIEASYNIWHY